MCWLRHVHTCCKCTETCPYLLWMCYLVCPYLLWMYRGMFLPVKILMSCLRHTCTCHGAVWGMSIPAISVLSEATCMYHKHIVWDMSVPMYHKHIVWDVSVPMYHKHIVWDTSVPMYHKHIVWDTSVPMYHKHIVWDMSLPAINVLSPVRTLEYTVCVLFIPVGNVLSVRTCPQLPLMYCLMCVHSCRGCTVRYMSIAVMDVLWDRHP